MRFLFALIGIAISVYVGSIAKRSEIAGVWRTRCVYEGNEILGTLRLESSGEVVLDGAITPIDPSLLLVERGRPHQVPQRTVQILAKGKWTVMFSALIMKFYESKPACAYPLDDLYGGSIENLDAHKLVLRSRYCKNRPAGSNVEAWFR